jgi:hypothetical protein
MEKNMWLNASRERNAVDDESVFFLAFCGVFGCGGASGRP